MIARCSRFFPCPSDALARAAGVALVACACGPSGAAAGVVSGTLVVEQAAIRSEGPKHDRDFVVMLDRIGAPPPPPAAGRATMDQRGLTFIPHVLAVQKGTTVRFLNNDPDPHNVYFLHEESGKTLDVGTWGPGVGVDHRFVEPGPVIVLCKLHLEMAAYVVVSGSPWFTSGQIDPATQKAVFSIGNVPAGEYTLSVWHKKLRPTALPARVVVPQEGRVEVPVVLTKASRAGKRR